MLRRLALPLDQVIGTSTLCCSTQTRHYAVPAKGNAAGGSRKKGAEVSRGSGGRSDAPADGRLEVIKKVLFESDPTDSERLSSLASVIPSLEVHETISRAWALHQRTIRDSHASELARKYDGMVQAIAKLEQLDPVLFQKVTGGRKFQNVDQKERTNARLEGLVPREMRVPVEVKGERMWDFDWKAPVVEVEGKRNGNVGRTK